MSALNFLESTDRDGDDTMLDAKTPSTGASENQDLGTVRGDPNLNL